MKDKEKDRKTLFTETLRDAIHNLDLSILDNKKIFSDHVRSFIRLHEATRFEAYDDKTAKSVSKILAAGEKTKGNITVGVGFNMDADNKKGGRKEWDAAFKDNIDKEKPDFDKIYDGKLELTQTQVDQLLDHSLSVRVKELEKIYEEFWPKLRANEKITIISAYFNCPSLVARDTNFYKNIREYAKTADKKYLLEAVTEIKDNSNKDKLKGIQNRRNCEAAMLDSTEAPFYSKPNSPLLPNVPMKVIPGETIVPIGMSRYFPKRTNSEYFIWRTQLDQRVRPAHLQNEGKVFRKKTIMIVMENLVAMLIIAFVLQKKLRKI